MGEEKLLEQLEAQNWNVVNSFHEKLVAWLRLYYFIGGMPEVVANYVENKDLATVRSIQKRILMCYENDFAKHAPYEIVPKIRLV